MTMTATTHNAVGRFIDKALILCAGVVLLFVLSHHGDTGPGKASNMTVQCGAGPGVDVRQGVNYSCP